MVFRDSSPPSTTFKKKEVPGLQNIAVSIGDITDSGINLVCAHSSAALITFILAKRRGGCTLRTATCRGSPSPCRCHTLHMPYGQPQHLLTPQQHATQKPMLSSEHSISGHTAGNREQGMLQHLQRPARSTPATQHTAVETASCITLHHFSA
jgi:hypothetical protein